MCRDSMSGWAKFMLILSNIGENKNIIILLLYHFSIGNGVPAAGGSRAQDVIAFYEKIKMPYPGL